MGKQPDTRWCKFGGVECVRSDRGRADCYVCSEVRARLSTLSRLQRDNFALATRIRELEAELQAAQQRIDVLQEEQEKACRALGLKAEGWMQLVA